MTSSVMIPKGVGPEIVVVQLEVVFRSHRNLDAGLIIDNIAESKDQWRKFSPKWEEKPLEGDENGTK